MAAVAKPTDGRPTDIEAQHVNSWWERQKGFECCSEVSVSKWDPTRREGKKLPGATRFTFISDTHGKHGMIDERTIPEDTDVVLHCGDLTNVGEPEQIDGFIEWAAGLSCKPKAVVVIAGNHDITLDEVGYNARKKRFMPRIYRNTKPEDVQAKLVSDKAKAAKIIYLRNEAAVVLGYKVFGSPESAFFYDWAFNLARGAPARELYSKIPDDTDILLTHGPPAGHGDLCSGGARAGDVDLLWEVERRVKPLVHAFGHIHEGHGVTLSGPLGGPAGGPPIGGKGDEAARKGAAKVGGSDRAAGTAELDEPAASRPLYGPGSSRVVYVNASTCTLRYAPSQPPLVVDLPAREGEIDAEAKGSAAGGGAATGGGGAVGKATGKGGSDGKL